jgi:carnitine 3-dehydrogenase / betainyl-CoA thioesterase
VADLDQPTWRPASVGLVGGGVIGGGWAARLVLNGIDVRIHDPAPDSARRVEELLAGARRAFASLTASPLPPEGSLRFCDSIEEAVGGVDFVQESVPERLELKRELLVTISLHTCDDAPIASSTSGLRPTDLQAAMRLPERLLVGHPFNPVYLIPLVELCAGERTAPAFLDRAAGLYRAIGMHPLRVRREIDGFLADRLLEALWREALWLVHDGIATVSELDDAIRYGAGLRWAFMGTFLTYRIAGGELGMRHFLAQFGPALALPWTKLSEVPELTDEFIDELVAQSDEQAAGRSVAELERLRDACLVSLLQGLRSNGVGAGATLASWERGLMAPVAGTAPDAEPVPAPLQLVVREIPPGWMDYNGHMTESRYLDLFSEATDGLLRWLGVTGDYLARGRSYFTVETHLSHLAQLFAQDRVKVSTQLLGHDRKRLHVFHVISRSREGGDGDQVVATAEQVMIHVDIAARSSTPADPQVLARVASLAQAHAALPHPERAGRRISLS